MTAFIGPYAKVDPHIVLPVTAQLGQLSASRALNEEFPRPIHISQLQQVLVLGPIGSRNAMLTAVYGQGDAKDEIYVFTGCYGNDLAAFEEAVVKRKSPGDPHRAQYELAITLIRRLLPWRQHIAMPSPQAGDHEDWGG